MKKVLAFVIAAVIALSAFGMLSFAVNPTWIVNIDHIYTEMSDTPTGWAGSSQVADAVLNINKTVYAGYGINVLGWYVADEGMSKVEFKIDNGAWKDFEGALESRDDVINIIAAPNGMDPALNNTCGFGTMRIPAGDIPAAAGNYTVTIRAISKDGSTSRDIITINLTVLDWNVSADIIDFDARHLVWHQLGGNQHLFTMNYNQNGVKFAKTGTTDPAWMEAVLPTTVDFTEYPYLTIVASSENGGVSHIYSPTVGHRQVLNLPADGIGHAQTFHKDEFNGEVTAIHAPQFPIVGADGQDVTFERIMFFKTEAAKNAYTYAYDVRFLSNIDALNVAGQAYSAGQGYPTDWRDAEVNSIWATASGWTGTNHQLVTVGYQIDDNEPVFNPEAFDGVKGPDDAGVWPATAAIRGDTGYSMRFNVSFPILEGTHTVKLVAQIPDAEYSYYEIGKAFTFTDVESGVKSAQLLLGDSLAFNVSALFPDGTAAPGLRVTAPNGDTQDLAPISSANGLSTFRFDGIFAQNMVDEYSLQLLDGANAISAIPAKTYSVREYADSLYATSAAALGYTDAKKAALDTLLADLLTFGAQAQLYKDANAADLADALTWVGGTKTAADTYVPVNVKAAVSDSAADAFAGASLTINNTLQIKVLFDATNGTAVKFTAGGITTTVPAADWTQQSGRNVAVSAPIPASTMASTYTITLVDANDTVLATATYSVESYLGFYKTVNAGFADAILNYGRSAAAFIAA